MGAPASDLLRWKRLTLISPFVLSRSGLIDTHLGIDLGNPNTRFGIGPLSWGRLRRQPIGGSTEVHKILWN
jgi:hypothetical protein